MNPGQEARHGALQSRGFFGGLSSSWENMWLARTNTRTQENVAKIKWAKFTAYISVLRLMCRVDLETRGQKGASMFLYCTVGFGTDHSWNPKFKGPHGHINAILHTKSIQQRKTHSRGPGKVADQNILLGDKTMCERETHSHAHGLP